MHGAIWAQGHYGLGVNTDPAVDSDSTQLYAIFWVDATPGVDTDLTQPRVVL